MAKFHHVAVLMGGTTAEREVSLQSGQAVTTALLAAGYSATPVVLDHDAVSGLPAKTEAIFLALHGGYGEGGGVQADLDRLGLPYTGTGAVASRLAMDKIATKKRLQAHNIATAEYAVLAPDDVGLPLELPLVVKPPRGGSSVGITRVFSESEWAAALAEARRHEAEVLVERYIEGREMTVGVVEQQPLPVIEIRPAHAWFDYEAKYGGDTSYSFPEQESDRAICSACQQLAQQTFAALEGRHLGRVDFRIDRQGTPFVLELNTIPGFTRTSLLPKAAAHAGIDFISLCTRIMELARHDGE